MSDLSTTEQNRSAESGRTDFLTSRAAYQLAEFTKIVPQFESITPRWLPRMLEWKPLECLRERQDYELINNTDYGLLPNAAKSQRIKARNGYPTPDDLDELLAKVWKSPSFFLAHPRAISAFGRECTRRGVPPVAVNLFGSQFITWRGVPLIPTNKLLINGKLDPTCEKGTTDILLLRTGEEKQGAIGLYQSGLPGEQSEGLSVRFMGIDNRGVGAYILLLYSSACILCEDAVGVLEGVEIGNYYDYK